jgi:DNA invertase Pin-like site-specific DNA recombinase
LSLNSGITNAFREGREKGRLGSRDPSTKNGKEYNKKKKKNYREKIINTCILPFI